MPVYVASLGWPTKVAAISATIGPGRGKDSDANPKKLKARMMISMVMDINKQFGDGKEHVTCYTCHRGSTMPLTAAP